MGTLGNDQTHFREDLDFRGMPHPVGSGLVMLGKGSIGTIIVDRNIIAACYVNIKGSPVECLGGLYELTVQ